MNKEAIKTILDAIKQESFVEGYRAKATDAEAMGLLISKYFEWNGLEILAASADALEDANFHTEAAAVREMLEKLNA